jgi:hypothetical protein
MKKLFLSCLPALLISTTVVLQAKSQVKNLSLATITNNRVAENISPYNLTYLAYQGYFKVQGITSAGALIEDINSGKINEIKLIQAAINAHQLTPETLNDDSYVQSVKTQLFFLSSIH